MPPRLKSVTFIELLIAIMLLSVIILAINGMDIFSRNQILASNQRVRVQNDVSRCLEHITRNASNTIGNEAAYGVDTAVYISPDSNNTTTLSFFTDTNGNGARDSSTVDYWIRYNLNTSSHNFNYCNHCANAACASCNGTEEVLAQDITAFSAAKNFNGNQVNITMVGCWDPTRTCGTPDNPSINLTTAVALPSLSTN